MPVGVDDSGGLAEAIQALVVYSSADVSQSRTAVKIWLRRRPVPLKDADVTFFGGVTPAHQRP